MTNKATRDRLDEAAAWHARLTSETSDDADWLAFEAWLADRANRAAYERIELALVRVEDGREEVLAADSSVLVREARGLRRPRGWADQPAFWPALAASIALAFTVGLFLWPKGTVYSTQRGETRTIALSDGSVVHLNTASRIRVQFSARERKIVMEDAEADFDVAKDVARPFTVRVGDRQVRVVGTQFNILHHDGRAVVTLRRGEIDVVPLGVAPREGAVHLDPGHEIAFQEGAGATVRTVNADSAFAWEEGRRIYADSSLQDVVSDLNRYFERPVRLDPAVKSLRFSGVLTIDSEDAVVGRLEAFLPVAAERTPTGIVLQAKHP